jgi:site-specific DNA recombinase
MRAAIYSRFSTDRQTESSIADQVRVCTEHADKEGWQIVARYEDQGISGAAMGNRPGLLSMLEAAKARAFDVLLVMDTSRLSRSSADLSKIADRMVFMGLRILAVQEPGADTGKDGWEIYFGLSGLMGQQFRKMTSKKTHTALESRAKRGRATGGRAFGYTSQNELIPAEADTVREIFTRYAAGETQRAIAKDLSARGIPSPRGCLWHVSAIHAMLHSDRYLGRLTWNRSAWRKDPDTGTRSRSERDVAEHVTAIREDLRLVSDETWAAVRARDAPTGNHNARPKYALSGLLLCDSCGRSMTLCGGSNTRGYGKQRYVCPNYKEHGNVGCSNDMSVARLTAEELIIEPMRARLLGDQNFLAAVSALKNGKPKNGTLAFEGTGAGFNRDFGTSSPTARPIASPGADGHADSAEGGMGTILAAFGWGSPPAPAYVVTDETSLLANAGRLRAALVSAATDALRDALRRTLGTVRCVPTVEGESRYLNAVFEGGDAALLDWLCIGETMYPTLVAGAGFEPATFGL